MENKIRLLRADEIEVRVGGMSKNNSGGFLLLYKDARVDMRILDEVYGPKNWQRTHEIINGNLFCNISIWDEDKGQWITKQDVGVESQSDATKGQASDAFKRAAFNWGIGRELYTAPFIWVQGLDKYDKFKVTSINYNDSNEIVGLEIWNEKTKKVAYKLGSQVQGGAAPVKPAPKSKPAPVAESSGGCQECGAGVSPGVRDFSMKQYNKVLCMDCQKK